MLAHGGNRKSAWTEEGTDNCTVQISFVSYTAPLCNRWARDVGPTAQPVDNPPFIRMLLYFIIMFIFFPNVYTCIYQDLIRDGLLSSSPWVGLWYKLLFRGHSHHCHGMINDIFGVWLTFTLANLLLPQIYFWNIFFCNLLLYMRNCGWTVSHI